MSLEPLLSISLKSSHRWNKFYLLPSPFSLDRLNYLIWYDLIRLASFIYFGFISSGSGIILFILCCFFDPTVHSFNWNDLILYELIDFLPMKEKFLFASWWSWIYSGLVYLIWFSVIQKYERSRRRKKEKKKEKEKERKISSLSLSLYFFQFCFSLSC